MTRLMKPGIMTIGTFLFFSCFTGTVTAQEMSATDIVRKADEKYRGEQSGFSVMQMTVIRPAWQRTVEFRSWSLGDDYALTLVTAPAREAGQTFLKRKNEMWTFNPAINRLIKLPPSMMSQGWMGSDYTNDDVLRESSAVKDYTHEILSREDLGGYHCFKIRLTARKDADVLWSYQIWWVDEKEFIVLRAELYDEDGALVRTETASDMKIFEGRLLPTVLELIPAETKGNRTVVRIIDMKFNIKLSESFFSQQNMKNVR
jgi:outer membrane lipoprotein-sorting protein